MLAGYQCGISRIAGKIVSAPAWREHAYASQVYRRVFGARGVTLRPRVHPSSSSSGQPRFRYSLTSKASRSIPVHGPPSAPDRTDFQSTRAHPFLPRPLEAKVPLPEGEPRTESFCGVNLTNAVTRPTDCRPFLLNGQRSDSIDGGGDGAHDHGYHRPAYHQQEERGGGPGGPRLSRLLGQVRRVSGGGAEESGSFVRPADGRVTKGGRQSGQRRARRQQNVREILGASLVGW